MDLTQRTIQRVNAPIPGAGDKGFDAEVISWNNDFIPLAKNEHNPAMKHIGCVIPKVLFTLIIVALASGSTRPDVKKYLLEVLS